MIRCEWDRSIPGFHLVTFCAFCRGLKVDHEILEVPAGTAPRWGHVLCHLRQCSACGYSDGPWVKESDVLAGL